MLAPIEFAPNRPSPLPALPLSDVSLGPVVMADDPCEAAFGGADPTGPRKYYRARYYDPKIARFISEDPFRFGGGLNFYVYVSNDPLDGTDPAGLAATFVCPFCNALIKRPPVPPPCASRRQQFWGHLSRALWMLNPGGLWGAAMPGMVAAPAAAAAEAAAEGTTFLGQVRGPLIGVPNGAEGPFPNVTAAGRVTGFKFVGGEGGNGLSAEAANVRVMDPTLPRGPSPGYPNGYANYTNAAGQPINPYTGQTVPPESPWWHIDLGGPR